jgi:uncharacterized membrane protein
MKTIEDSITVDVPVSRAYNQWTQFEEFHVFMGGIKEVIQLDDKRLHWKAEIAGKIKEWDAEIFEQVPDQRIAWRSTGGAKNSGTINFTPLGAEQTKLSLHLDYDPKGIAENLGDAFGVVSAKVAGDLKRFKDFIEKRPASGGWRGEIHGQEVQPAASAR